jgi:hypothetical protein
MGRQQGALDYAKVARRINKKEFSLTAKLFFVEKEIINCPLYTDSQLT